MNLPMAAAKEFDGILAAGEAGWADEAHTRAEALRAQVKQRRAHWKAAREAGQHLIEDGTPIPDALYDVTGTVTLKFHDAVRSAPSRERVLALLPLARALDGLNRNTRLAAYVQRIAASDFRVRKPLAERYRELALGRATPEAIRALLAAVATGPDDIKMGTIVVANQVGARLDEYRRLAAATGDPWFLLIAEQAAAAVDNARGDYPAAEHRLRDAIALANRERLSYRANRLENDLIDLHIRTQLLSLAGDEASRAYRDAIAAGEWVFEMNGLADLSSIEHNRNAYGLARAYLSEIALRGDAGLAAANRDAWNCEDRMYAYGSLANISVMQFDPDRARVELSSAPTCEMGSVNAQQAAVLLRTAFARAELYRFGHRTEDAQLARDSLAVVRSLPATIAPGKDAIVAYLAGLLAIQDDPAAGQRLLRDAIALAGHDTRDEYQVKARSLRLRAACARGRTDVGVRPMQWRSSPSRCACTCPSAAPLRSPRTPSARSWRFVTHPVRSTASTPQRTSSGRSTSPRWFRRARSRGCAAAVRWRCWRTRRCSEPGACCPLTWPGATLSATRRLRHTAAGAHRLVVANPDAPPELSLPALRHVPRRADRLRRDRPERRRRDPEPRRGGDARRLGHRVPHPRRHRRRPVRGVATGADARPRRAVRVDARRRRPAPTSTPRRWSSSVRAAPPPAAAPSRAAWALPRHSCAPAPAP